MRDLLLTAIILGAVPFILRRPHIGVLMWVWVSVMNPHRLTYGFAFNFNYAAIVAVVTLVAAVLSRELRPPPVNSVVVALCLFVSWTAVTTAFALYPADAYESWTTLIKTMLMVALIPMLFHRKEQMRQLIWVLVLSVGYYGVKGGVWILLTGGGERVWGPAGSYIEDNNALATVLVMMIPMMRYLQLTAPAKHVRWGLTAMMLLCGVSVLGSYSRGAFLAATAMLTMMFWKSRHRLVLAMVGILAIPFALAFMPDKWHDRMDTIATYEEDSSANMRLNAWGTMFNIAKDRPLTGAGFEVATQAVYDRYSPRPGFPPQVAHSIYFQALGEHGFVGLGLYLWLYFALWRAAGRLARAGRERESLAWAGHFGLMTQVSLVGYAVGGAFLSLVNFDVPYYLIGAVLVVRAIVERELRRDAPTPTFADARRRLAGMGGNGAARPRASLTKTP